MTFLAPMSSEKPSSVVQQNQRILVTMNNAKSLQQMDGRARKLKSIGNIRKKGFQMTAEHYA